MLGTMKFYNDSKGYGFAIGENGIDFFVHITNVADEVILQTGDKIEFTTQPSQNGGRPLAVNVRKI
ncbi:MAG: cold-shock protein [Deltaproteobacteria bacterium HGW-Deltaproteobacteria-15]|nr:MAG: cold-shock protein [Deltaproteobacteria bacterium HGW-Deltaproteobacteria-15]